MISFDEVFSSVKQYCREKGAIPDVAVKLWINALHPSVWTGMWRCLQYSPHSSGT